jgi:hypothetical protein
MVMRYEGYENSDGQIKRRGLPPDDAMVTRVGDPFPCGKAIGLMAKFVYTCSDVTKQGRQFG